VGLSEVAPRLTRRKTSGGVIFLAGSTIMSAEPFLKGVIAFIDEQNLYHAARGSLSLYLPFDMPTTAIKARR